MKTNRARGNMTDFEIIHNENELYVKIPFEFRTGFWNINFGELQKVISLGTYLEDEILKIYLDLSECIWADPLPMLSLLILLSRYKEEKKENQIVLYLAAIDYENNVKKSNVFLTFLVQEDFISVFQLLCNEILFITDNSREALTKQHLQYLNMSSFMLNYNNSHILSAEIKNLKQVNIGEYVHQLLDRMSDLHGRIPNIAIDKMYTKIYQILFEIIDNVKKHAYPRSDPYQFVGIYIRYRNGLNKNATELTSEQKERLSFLANKEEKNHPLLSREIIDNSEGFFEIFIIDSGCGLKSTLSLAVKKTRGGNYHSSFFGCFQSAFFHKIRSTRQKMITAYGGLDLISQLLRPENDFIFALEGNEWIGFNASEKSVNLNKHHRTINPVSNSFVNGLSYIFRLSWASDDIRHDNDISYYKKDESHPVYNAFRNESASLTVAINNTYCFDQRNDINQKNTILREFPLDCNHFVWLPGKLNNKNEIINALERYASIYKLKMYLLNNNISEYITNYCNTTDDWFSFIVRKHLKDNTLLEIIANDKVDLRLLNNAIMLIENKYPEDTRLFKNQQRRNLLILDIPSHELVIYKNSLNNKFVYKLEAFMELFNQIIICSTHYEVIAFTFNNLLKKFELNIEVANSYVNMDSGQINMVQAALWLRYYESTFFWQELSSLKNKNDLFINAEIDWNSKKRIKGYLNLENIICIPDLFEFLKKTVYRTLGYVQDKNALFIGSDVLVQQIVEECNIIQETDICKMINVDSVYTTGLTASTTDIKSDSINISLFRHPSCDNTNAVSPLLLWPNEKWLALGNPPRFEKIPDIYKRIGNTHLIDKFNSNLTIIDRKMNSLSSYNQDSEKTYGDLQIKGLGFARIGHFHYDGNHDFINYKFINIIESSYRSRKGAFLFLLKHFFFALLNTENHIDVKKQIRILSDDWRDAIQTAYENQEDDWGRAAVIVFPSHNYSAHTIRLIKKCLPEYMSERIIPINTVSRRNNGFIISPVSIETIKNKFNETRSISENIIIFDTIINSGRTRKIIKHVLLSKLNLERFENSAIKTLCIIDSYRLPYSSPNRDRHRSFWRFDVPRLGISQSCKLCHAIDNVIELKKEITNIKEPTHSISEKEVHDRIEKWIENWKCISALDHSSAHGLAEATIPQVEFSTVYNDFSPLIKTNIGLALYISEMQSIQLRDDIIMHVIKFLKANKAYEQIVMIISCRILQFGDYSSKSFHGRVLIELLNALSQLTADNNYSALGALTLALQEPNVLETAVLQYVPAAYSPSSDFPNLDLNIILSHLAQHSDKIYNTLPANITDIFDHKTRLNSYISLHFELYNDGGSIHTNSLEEFVGNGFDNPKQNYNKKLIDVASTLQSLLKSLDTIKSNEFIKTGEFKYKSYEIVRTEINDICDEISIYTDMVEDDYKKKKGANILMDTRSIYHYMRQAHAGLFAPLGKRDYDNAIINKIRNIIIDGNEVYTLKMNNDIKAIIKPDGEAPKPDVNVEEIWYYWNIDIEQEFIYLINNAKHSCGEIISAYGEVAHMLVSVNYSVDNCIIILRNISTKHNEEIIKKFRQKGRSGIKRNKELEVNIEVKSKEILKGDDRYRPFENYEQVYELETRFIIPSVKYKEGGIESDEKV